MPLTTGSRLGQLYWKGQRILSITGHSRQIALGVPLLLVLFVTGCAHSVAAKPKPTVDARSVVNSIVLCSTTESELRQKLGEPYRDGILHRRRVVSWIAQWDSPTRYLAVLLDDHGVVVDVYWDIPTEVPWVPTNQCGGQ
jgi:hypothetical protein